MTLADDIRLAETRVNQMELRFNQMDAAMRADGRLTVDERQVLDILNSTINTAIERLNELVERENVEVQMDSVGAVNMEETEVEGDLVPFDTSASQPDFKESIRTWSIAAAGAVESARNDMRADAESASMSIGDVLGIVAFIFPGGGAVASTAAAISTFLPVLRACVATAFPAGSEVLPLNIINQKWREALLDFGGKSHDEAYDRFITYWTQANGLDANATRVPSSLLIDLGVACKNFGNEVGSVGGAMPTFMSIKRAFVNELLSMVPDSFDLDGESGDAEINITELGGVWHDPSGQLDDVSGGLLNAIQTVYSNARIIDLPVVINITVYSNGGIIKGGFQRRSATPGNTDFRQTDGESELFDSFMSTQAFNIPLVSHLTVDS